MKNIKKEEEEGSKLLYSRLKFVAIILLVVCLGLISINQFLEWKFNAQLLGGPCGFCEQLNPNQSECIHECFTVKYDLFSDGFGNWDNQPGPQPNLYVNLSLLK